MNTHIIIIIIISLVTLRFSFLANFLLMLLQIYRLQKIVTSPSRADTWRDILNNTKELFLQSFTPVIVNDFVLWITLVCYRTSGDSMTVYMLFLNTLPSTLSRLTSNNNNNIFLLISTVTCDASEKLYIFLYKIDHLYDVKRRMKWNLKSFFPHADQFFFLCVHFQVCYAWRRLDSNAMNDDVKRIDIYQLEYSSE